MIGHKRAVRLDHLAGQQRAEGHRDVVVVSARTGEGIDELERAIAATIPRPDVRLELLIPFTRGELVSRLHSADAEILAEGYEEGGTRLSVLVREDIAPDFAEFVVEADAS